MKRIAVLVVLVLAVAGVVWSQSVPRATADMRLAWDQDAESLADAQAYVYTAYVDGATAGTVITPTCTGTTTPFVCAAPLPVTSIGAHSVIVAAQTALDGGVLSVEARSLPFNFRIVGPATAPGRLRLIR